MSVLLASRVGPLLRLTLNRPERRNALSPELARALTAALAEAREDASVRAVLLTGAGDAFCAGGDFDAMLTRRGDALATQAYQRDVFAPLVRGILELEKPVIAHVNGHAFGAGLMLVLACDFAIAVPRAKFAASFAKVGLIPDLGGTFLLPHLLGLRAARELALLGEPVESARALALGIVNEVDDEAATRADALAVRLANGPTLALGLAKKALVLGAQGDLESALAREASYQGLCFTTKDHAEGVDAFLEKRAAVFKGE